MYITDLYNEINIWYKIRSIAKKAEAKLEAEADKAEAGLKKKAAPTEAELKA